MPLPDRPPPGGVSTAQLLPAVVAGFVAVLVGFTSSVALVFAAAQSLGASAPQMASWVWALGLGMGLTSMGLSWWYRQPVLTAWSTPGAALIAGSTGLTMAEATGAFMLCGLLVVLAGVTRAFERLMDRIPQSLAAALLAGVLARFGLDAVGATLTAPALVLSTALAYLAGRRLWPRYAVPGVLLVGVLVALAQGQLGADMGTSASAAAGSAPALSAWAVPVLTWPQWSWAAMLGLGLPLFLVTMASQNLPGVAAQRAAGYDTPVSAPVAVTGLATLLLAPFGAYALNLAAITAAICMGREAGEDPAQRWRAAFAAGVFYVLLGLAGAAVVQLLLAFPRELVIVVAGLALLGTIGQGLARALADEAQRDAAVITFLVTLSGIQALGLASAFWGMVAGVVAALVQQYPLRARRRAAAPSTQPEKGPLP
jgi:benzoate membrane transport protein